LRLNFIFVKNGKSERKNTPSLRAAPFTKRGITETANGKYFVSFAAGRKKCCKNRRKKVIETLGF
jgi:hypothetical protein